MAMLNNQRVNGMNMYSIIGKFMNIVSNLTGDLHCKRFNDTGGYQVDISPSKLPSAAR